MYGEAVAMLYYIDFKPYKIESFVSSLTPVTKMLITSYFSNVLISCLLNKLFNLILNLCVIYKMANGLAATNAMDLFQPAEKAHRYETRSNINGKFKKTKTQTKKAETAFSNFGPKIWNEIPAELREVQSFDSFKLKVKSYMVSQHERD